jgi:hypothetical protein
VPEVWIENLTEDVLLVSRDPAGDKYNTQWTLHRGEQISPLAFPRIRFKVEQLLG